MFPEAAAQQDTKFELRAVGNGYDVCNQINNKSTTCVQFGTKQCSSETASDTSHRQGQKFCSPPRNTVTFSEPGGKRFLAGADNITKAERNSSKDSSDERNHSQSCSNANSGEIVVVQTSDFLKKLFHKYQ